MTVEEIKALHLAYWRHTEGCWHACDPAKPDGRGQCAEHDRLYDAWQAALMRCDGVYVNAASIVATGQGKEFWDDFLRYRPDHRVEKLTESEYFVMCDGPQHAAELSLQFTVYRGIPSSAVKLKTFGQCQRMLRRS